MVPSGDKTAKFWTMAAPRMFFDDPTVFPTVARIPDAMLKLVDPKHLLLVQYLALIDSSTPVGVLPPKGQEDPLNITKLQRRRSKDEFTNEILLSKSGILKRTKKPTKKPNDSLIKQSVQEPEIKSTEQTNVDSSNTLSSTRV